MIITILVELTDIGMLKGVREKTYANEDVAQFNSYDSHESRWIYK